MRIAPLLAAVALMLAAGCSQKDKVISVSADDAEMNAAIARGRDTLPQFWKVFQNPEHGETNFALKVKITDGKGTEYFWAIDLEHRDGKTMGTINNDAETVKTVKLGDRIAIPAADMADWSYFRDGKMVGNYTLRPLMKHMPAAEVEQLKRMLADP